MRCPYCNHRDSRVTDSRANDEGIRRRRQCIACGERFSTFEGVQLANILVIKRDGRREEFARAKLIAGLRKACSKRNVSVAQIEGAAAEIEARIMADGRPEVAATALGELAMDALRSLDHIAYIRFASVYRPFADLASLKEAVIALETSGEEACQLVLPGTPREGPARTRRPLVESAPATAALRRLEVAR